MAMRKREDDEVYPNAAGIDVGASSHWVAVPRTADHQPVREFGTMTGDLHAMADWLLACGVDTVALESTGVYWIPVYEVLEQRGLTVWLVDARQMKYVPGRKSDVQDCQWLQKLMSLGLLRAAWCPAGEVCVVRAVVRQRELLLTEQGSWVQRMQKALLQMIIRAIVAGERDPKVLARFRHSLVEASTEDIIRALTGNWREEHLFVLAQALAMFDSLAERILECDAKTEALLVPLGRHDVQLAGPDKKRQKNAPRFDARTALARWTGVDLTRINGLSVATVMTILSEIGPDLSRFASVKHFCSWLRLCPATKISGGKTLSSGTRPSANRARQALKMAAMSLSRSDSALGAFYRRLCSRMDKPRANTAVAHKLARMVYFMLTRGEAFVDQGQQRYQEQQRQRSIAALRRRASALGFQLQPNAPTP
ncbi:IS110 family transposase [Paraburkholderia sp. 31.1]|uniref:IS110 family transposase n=1 Tax=Paraburkholderia sp. 31.1 TaxID=2615205 RepID=UPI0016554665|nr:IS110 family transposase [Paraburkholderia sp. 31.1]MBC8725857.1 IS110 family transposase [Paraburkholderia sp. 31.1]